MAPPPIYLDNNATTRTDPRVLEAMLPFFTERYGNAASRHHAFGRDAEEAVQQAREQVAGLIGAEAREIVFTSGATESDNLALKGAAWMQRQLKKGSHLVTAATEHHAVLDPAKRLQRDGFQLTILPVDRHGQVSVDQVACSRSPTSAGCVRNVGCCFTPMRCRPSARCRSTWKSAVSTCSA
jgi:cysteine desulfurase